MVSATFNEELKQEVQQRMQTGTPRFLFRTWHEKSGGQAVLNTITGVTPLRFQIEPAHSENFFENEIQDLADTADGHLTGKQLPHGTVFSSWTHSLPQAFSWTCHFLKKKRKDLHICILDTKKLPGTQMVLHCSALHDVVSKDIDQAYDHELLAYGPLRGPAYKAVSLDAIDINDLEKFFPGVKEDQFHPKAGEDFANKGDANALFSAANNIGKLFGEYNLAVQAHLLACVSHVNSNHRVIVDELSSSAAPEEWLHDPDPKGLDTAGHTEAQRAAIIMRDLAIRAHCQGVPESTSEERKALQDLQATRREKMLESKSTDPEMPKRVRESYLAGTREGGEKWW